MVKEQMEKVVFRKKKDKTWEDSTKGIPFTVTLHPKLTGLAKKIKDLSKSWQVKIVFPPVVSFRSV